MSQFWSPVKELMRWGSGWKGSRNDGLEAIILLEEGELHVFVRQGSEGVFIGSSRSLGDAAWLWWTWGRENRWPRSAGSQLASAEQGKRPIPNQEG